MTASVSHQQNDTKRAAFDRENGVQRLKRWLEAQMPTVVMPEAGRGVASLSHTFWICSKRHTLVSQLKK